MTKRNCYFCKIQLTTGAMELRRYDSDWFYDTDYLKLEQVEIVCSFPCLDKWIEELRELYEDD